MIVTCTLLYTHVTQLQLIYNSHYGIGSPAMFTSYYYLKLRCKHCRKKHCHKGVVDTGILLGRSLRTFSDDVLWGSFIIQSWHGFISPLFYSWHCNSFIFQFVSSTQKCYTKDFEKNQILNFHHFFYQSQCFDENKIEGTPILKLAMVK